MKTLFNKKDGLSGRGRRIDVVKTELGYLWSSLIQRGVRESHKVLGLGAIGEDEGSSTLAANLALFLGSKGMKVTFIECSMRNPAMAKYFKVDGKPGLAELLSGDTDLASATRKDIAPGVDLIPGGVEGDPYWSFTTDAFEQVTRQLTAESDIVLVDVPALNRAPEASLVIRSIDALVMVVEANRHRADIVRRNVAYLRSLGTPLLGIFMSEVEHELPVAIGRYL